MGRQVITARDLKQAAQAAPGTATAVPMSHSHDPTQPTETSFDDYRTRLLKYIPAEVVAVYLTVATIVGTMGEDDPRRLPLLWIVSTALLLLTPVYLSRIEKVTKVQQLVISTASFAVWVFTLGGPFEGFAWYDSIYGAALLPLYTFGAAMWGAEGGRGRRKIP